jgi:ankyrin repeat protein
LLQRGANPNAVRCAQRTFENVLSFASAKDNVEAIELLVQYGARIDEADNDGWNALLAAAVFKSTRAAKQLLALGANPNARSRDGDTALTLAVNSFEFVSLLIAAGADAKIVGCQSP